jgi:AcrR family transcriptional regulator
VQSSAEGSPVTVASVCRAAGCTPPTLYHHFADLADLRRTACQNAFHTWKGGIERRVGGADDPAERLRIRGRAYLEWGIAHPAAYRVLFLSDTPSTPEDSRPGEGFDQLTADIATLMRVEPSEPAVMTAALAHWSAVHGVTTLAITTPGLPTRMWHDTLDHLSAALAAAASVGRSTRRASAQGG